MGPVDYLVVEFPGNRMTGEGLAAAGRPGRPRHHPDPRLRLRDEGDRRLGARDGDRRLRRRRRSSTSRCSRARRPACSTRATSARPAACSSRAARPASSSTRTCGRRRSPPPCGVVAPRWSRAVGSRSRRCWRPWTHSSRGLRGLSDARAGGEQCQDFFVEWRGPRWSPVRRPRSPTASPAARPAAGPSRSSSSTRSRPTAAGSAATAGAGTRGRTWTTSSRSSRNSAS